MREKQCLALQKLKKGQDGKDEDNPRKPSNQVTNWGLSFTTN